MSDPLTDYWQSLPDVNSTATPSATSGVQVASPTATNTAVEGEIPVGSDEWVRAKANAANAQIQSARSTEILRGKHRSQNSSATNADADTAAGASASSGSAGVAGTGVRRDGGGATGDGPREYTGKLTDQDFADMKEARNLADGLTKSDWLGLGAVAMLGYSPSLAFGLGQKSAAAQQAELQHVRDLRTIAETGPLQDGLTLGVSANSRSSRDAADSASGGLAAGVGVGPSGNSRAARDAADANRSAGAEPSVTGDPNADARDVAAAGNGVANTAPAGAATDMTTGESYGNEGRRATSGESSGGGSSRVICTHFYRKGAIDAEVWRADLRFTCSRLSDRMVRGYQWWAIPYVRLMRKSPLAERLMRPLALARARELAYQMGVLPRPDYFGKLVRWTLEPVCWLVGGFVGDQDWKSLWAKETKGF